MYAFYKINFLTLNVNQQHLMIFRNVSVCWTIEAASVFDMVKMEVISMDIESNSDCKDGDFIEVRDGRFKNKLN